MLGFRRTMTFPKKELEETIAKSNDAYTSICERLLAFERFEDDVRDVMDYMEHDEQYFALNDALARLNK